MNFDKILEDLARKHCPFHIAPEFNRSCSCASIKAAFVAGAMAAASAAREVADVGRPRPPVKS